MPIKPSETTQFALIGKDIAQIQKDVSALGTDVKSLINARFVTQNELLLAISASESKQEKENKPLKMIGSAVITAVILAIVAGLMNLLLKG